MRGLQTFEGSCPPPSEIQIKEGICSSEGCVYVADYPKGLTWKSSRQRTENSKSPSKELRFKEAIILVKKAAPIRVRFIASWVSPLGEHCTITLVYLIGLIVCKGVMCIFPFSPVFAGGSLASSTLFATFWRYLIRSQ